MKNHRLNVVLGMHRSGTSAVTRGLQVLGVQLGDRMMPPLEGNNPTGFWEDIDLNLLNLELLKAIGSDWHRLAPFEASDTETLRRTGLFLRAVELLRRKVSGSPVFGLKDPRVTKLLPFWKAVFSHCQLDMSYVLAVRNPLSVVRSLARRDGLDAGMSYLLWLDHVITSLTATAGDKRVLVDYDRLMQAPDHELNRLAKCLDLAIDPAELQRYKSEFLDEGLRHTVFDLKDLGLDKACPPLVYEIYAALMEVASDITQLDDPALLKKVALWANEFERLSSLLTLADRLTMQKTAIQLTVAERDGQIGALNHAVAECDGQIGALNHAVAERDGQIGALNHAVAERDGQIGALNHAVAERDGQIGHVTAERDMARFTLNAMLSSSSWRLTRPFRWIGSQIKRAPVLLRWLLVGPFRLLTFIKDRLLGVIERFYKLFCFWRNHGTRSLVRLIFFKLKAQDTQHPVPEERFEVLAKRGARDLAGFRFEACTPLRVYSTPNKKPSRISIVTDSINSGSLFGGVGTAMIMAALLAEARGARLRVVTRTESAQQGNLGHVLATYGIQLTHEVEFAFAPFYDRRYEIDVFDDELFITTSWWTTAATMASVPHDSIIYLLQEDERMFYPYGDDHLRCTQVLRSQKIHFVLNTQLLFDHLVADGLGNIAERGFWFEPAFPREVFHPRALKASGKRTLMFYARPNNLRNLFYFGIELIEEAITRGTIDLTKWDILLVGKDIPDVEFGDGHVPEKRENLTWAEYAELAGKVDLGLCLMYTPHPSYPPLDLAASGAVVVTNRFGNKQDLGNYSKNIVCGDLDRESMIGALAEGIRLATNTAERSENHRSSALGSDWRLSFSEVVQRFAKVR